MHYRMFSSIPSIAPIVTTKNARHCQISRGGYSHPKLRMIQEPPNQTVLGPKNI